MKDADFVFDRERFVLRPETRMGRILPVIRDQAMGVGDILRALWTPGQGPVRKERKHISKQLHRMQTWGIVAHAGVWGWTATEYGRDLVDAMRAAPPTAAPPLQSPSLPPAAGADAHV